MCRSAPQAQHVGRDVYAWKAKYGGMTVSDAKRLKALEEEDARLEDLLAEPIFGASAMRKLLAKKRQGSRQSVTPLRITETRMGLVVGAALTRIRHRSVRPPEAALRRRLRGLADERRRLGYRRLFVPLRQKGAPSGANRICRLEREEGLSVGKQRARRKAIGSRVLLLAGTQPSVRWSRGFVHDQRACGWQFRILNALNDVT